MRVLLLHSDIPADAPPDELDTLVAARAVSAALRERRHQVLQRAFVANPALLESALAEASTECVFNLVESVFAQGDLAGLAAAMLEKRNVPYTGASAATLGCAANKPLTKRILAAAGLPTPHWSEPPRWEGLTDGRQYVVKSANEDASIGLDDGAVLTGCDIIRARAASCVAHHGGTWFAEEYCPGREFNVSLLEESGQPRILPIAEIQFENWAPDRPRLVGYAAKWDARSADCVGTPRVFGIEAWCPRLAKALERLACSAWRLLGMNGYARVDFRLDPAGAPMILEINPNPCLEPRAGFAAAALEAGISYTELVDGILRSATGH